MKLFIAFAGLFGTGILALAGDRVIGGPFVVNVGPKSATVVTIVESGQISLTAVDAKQNRTAPVLRADKVTFTGLQPGTRYFIGASGRDEGKGEFTTAPLGPARFQFVVFGDTRTRHDMHRRVVDAIRKQGSPDFVIHTGDLVADGGDTAQWPVFFDIERELLRKSAFFPSLGNHERNNRQYYEFFNVGQPYYSFDWGTSHFIILNSDIGNSAGGATAREAFWQEQVRWLEDDLAKSQKADFRFLAAHHPPFTAVASRQGSNREMAALVPLFEKYRLTAGFFGHDHNYQHYLKDGIHYVITGGGGAPLYDVSKPPVGITKKVASTEHFVRIEVNGPAARIEAITLDGAILDRIDLER